MSRTNYLSGRPGTVGNLAPLALPPQFLTVAAPGNRSTDVPGPAAGFVRVLDVYISPAVSGSNPVGIVSLQPLNAVLRLSATISGTQGVPRMVLGVGETIRFTNSSGNAAIIAATYVDLPATGLGLVRASLTNAFQTLIPAPTAGLQRRWFQFPAMNDSPTTAASNTQCIVQTRAWFVNGDNITHTVEQELGGIVIGRSASASQGERGPLTGIMQAPVTVASGPMRYRTLVAISLNPVYVLGAYETLPL